MNLDARDVVPLNAVFSPLDPTSFNTSTSLTVYDSLGVNHVGALYFQRQAIAPTTGSITAATSTLTVAASAGLSIGNTVTIAGAGAAGAPLTTTITAIAGNVLTLASPASTTVAGAAVTSNAGSANWNAYLTVDGVSVPIAGTALATLTFNSLGQLVAPLGPPLGQVASAAFTPTGAAAQTLAVNFAQTSQYGGKFGVNTLTQDGYTSGRLTGFGTGSDGVILGRYSNGQTRALGQILLANFTNPQGLQPMGNNEWVETSTSGGALIGLPGSSSLGLLQSSAVEDSNVDLTAELVSMITAQRVYQANAQTIKAQDQVLQTLVNLR
jgi:flagellar hook protein FlgE